MWFKNILKKRTHKKKESSTTIIRLAELTKELDHIDSEIIEYGELLRNIINSDEYAVWAKDCENHFVYANKLCCDVMLHCSEIDVLTHTGIARGVGLAIACNDSDEAVKASGKPMRFIEHNSTWWDTTKSPLYNDDKLIGTVGRARDITYIIPDDIKNITTITKAIVIPMDTELCPERIHKLIGTQ